VLFVVCSAAAIASIVPLGATVESPVDLAALAGRDGAVVTTALIEGVWVASGMGIAIALYPVLRLSHPTLALAAAVGRVVENVFILIGTLSLLALLTVSQRATASGATTVFQPTADSLVAVRQWAPGFLAGLAFVAATASYNHVMYRARLVPRWLSGWGLAGAAASLVAYLVTGFTQDFGFTTVNDVLSAPIALQEMTLAVWLLVKGFHLSPAAPAPSAPAPSVRSRTAVGRDH
jgi:hypothetical protein